MNQAMFDATTYNYFGENRSYSALMLFDGTYSLDEFLGSAASTSSGNFYLLPILQELAANTDCTMKGYMWFEQSLVARRPNEDTVVFPLSESRRELEKESEGAVTWFMYVRSYNSISNSDITGGSLTAQQIIVGSVGDIGSGADMEFPGAALSNDVDYKATDLTLKLV